MRNVMITALVSAVFAMGCTSRDDSAETDSTEVQPTPVAEVQPADGNDAEPTPIDAQAAIAAASAAIGADDLDSIMISGTANNVSFGQTPNINGPYDGMGTEINEYVRMIDLDPAAPRSFATGSTFEGFRGGPPEPGRYNLNVPPESGWAQQMEIWMSPWGFLKGAAANNATATSETIEGQMFDVVRWSPSSPTAPSGAQYEVVGYIDSGTNLLNGVETWVEYIVAGDLNVQQRFGDWQMFNGVMAPGTIWQTRMGRETFRAQITGATANPADLESHLASAPPPSEFGGGASAEVTSEELGRGVYRITGGYESLAVEFEDYIAIFEGGQSEARGLAVIEEARRVIPDKEIRYVINSHPHFDHAEGLPPFVAEGITVLTHENNMEFLTEALGAPRTLVGDTLAASGARPKVEGVGDLLVLEDDTGQRLELHHVKDNDHTDGMLVAYMPEVRILFQADLTLPAPGQKANPYVVALAENVKRLGLEFDRYMAVHANAQQKPVETYQDLMEAVER